MSPPADRARAWRRAMLAAVCDLVEPWEHGTVFRATGYPSYWDYNVVRVDGDPGFSAAELIAVADDEARRDRASAGGLPGRRGGARRARRLRGRAIGGRRGWFGCATPSRCRRASRRGRGGRLRRGARPATRLAQRGGLPGIDQRPPDNAREVAMTRGMPGDRRSRTASSPSASPRSSHPVATRRSPRCTCARSYRGSGRGTALTRAAIEAASATSTTSGSSPTTRTGRSSSMRGSASGRRGPRPSSCAYRESA